MELSFALPVSAPTAHRAFVASAVPILACDPRIVGVAAAGSWADDAMDEHSDVDLVVAVASSAFDEVMADRERIASTMGDIVSCFTGEHVGEPRVLICLYASPLLHVDLKFVDIDRIGDVVDRPAVLWERQAFGKALARAFSGYPKPEKAWLEKRFWTWIHYGVTKVLRGELFEAIDLITFLRGRVLGPLILEAVGAAPTGVRRLETAAPGWARRLEATVAAYAPSSCLQALEVCAESYRALRISTDEASSKAEHAAMRFLSDAKRAVRSA
ncbi:MAG: hypothetical protein ACTIJY_09210 [Luteimonas sp.]